MKQVSVTFKHDSPQSRFSAIMHIDVAVKDGSEMEQQRAITKATGLLWQNVDNPEWWHYLGITGPYETT